ncbi:alpha/beta hydrolase [Fulvivirga sp. RKSG066]|uniref:alpha/beta hydrolase n=1 Tax=Fulvivirga aurantia TaxID=2529383 RepID=UPI0012BBBC21|nr:alpha/beta hydrolase [Fulvivirga aurantia]MTI21029.1 alpha/beta hydrolase [Fulvivirga aurantia]
MKQHYTIFEHKARFFQLGDFNAQTKNLIFVLHGYGQQAKYFIQKFKGIDDGNNCIVAPEGLSRFYLEGFSGRVGATWMTKEDRLTDIDNYINYLDAVYETFQDQLNGLVKVSIIGFSQGAATASRWLANTHAHVNQLILWAGIFPPDLDYDLIGNKFKSIDIKYVYGLQDPFLNDNRIEEMRKISSHLMVEPQTITFKGEHNIDTEVLKEIFG